MIDTVGNEAMGTLAETARLALDKAADEAAKSSSARRGVCGPVAVFKTRGPAQPGVPAQLQPEAPTVRGCRLRASACWKCRSVGSPPPSSDLIFGPVAWVPRAGRSLPHHLRHSGPSRFPKARAEGSPTSLNLSRRPRPQHWCSGQSSAPTCAVSKRHLGEARARSRGGSTAAPARRCVGMHLPVVFGVVERVPLLQGAEKRNAAKS